MEYPIKNEYIKAGPDPISEIPDEEFEPLDDGGEDTGSSKTGGSTYLRDTWRRFKKNRLALFSAAFIIVVILLAVFVPVLSPYTYDEMDPSKINSAPSLSHWFGTDQFGRDIFVRIMYGARISLSVGVVAAIINLVIGVTYGVICGYIGGKTDMILMRLADIIYAVPTLLYVILIMLVFGSNIYSVLIAIGISSWVAMARLVRGQVISLKEKEFTEAAVIIGAGRLRIMFRHLIINCLGTIIVNTTLMVPSAIFTEAFLAFVGIGISIPQASWGTMANEARSLMQTQPIQMLWPVLAICSTMLSLNFIGDGLSEALNPKDR